MLKRRDNNDEIMVTEGWNFKMPVKRIEYRNFLKQIYSNISVLENKIEGRALNSKALQHYCMRMQHLFNELQTRANTADACALEFNRFSAITATGCTYQRL